MLLAIFIYVFTIQLITFIPRFCVLNCMDEVVYLSQQHSKKYCEYFPFSPNSWHKLEGKKGTNVLIRLQSTIWSLGSIELNELGASVLYIPYKKSDFEDQHTTSGGIVVHVEVKLAEHCDNCSLVVIIWRETVTARSAFLIQNDSDVVVTVRQAGKPFI